MIHLKYNHHNHPSNNEHPPDNKMQPPFFVLNSSFSFPPFQMVFCFDDVILQNLCYLPISNYFSLSAYNIIFIMLLNQYRIHTIFILHYQKVVLSGKFTIFRENKTKKK